MKWNFVNTGYNTGVFNMETDVQLARAVGAGESLPTLRLYGWKPYAISIGMNQRLEDFDRQKLNAAGIDIVRRPTGGMAIFHADEITYSVTMNIEHRSLRETYHFINEGLLSGLHGLGVQAELSRSTDDFRELYGSTVSIPCFTSSAKSEIQFEGRKLLGSAQRRYNTIILQHGSLLLGPAHREIVNYLSSEIQYSKENLLKHLDNHAIDLNTILRRTVTFEEAAECIREGFARACGIDFIEAEITDRQPIEA
jgi:lipoate-protein ligase A